MFDFFISHSSKDKDWVKELVEALNERTRDSPLVIWFDENNISPGDYIFQQIEDGITNSNHIGVVLSPESVNSDWVSFERMIFQTMDPLGREKKLIPLLLRDCKIPTSLKAIKYIDFREKNNFNSGIDQLLRTLKRPHKQSSGLLNKIEESLDKSKIYRSTIDKYIYQLDNDVVNEIYTWIEKINIKGQEGREQVEQVIFKILGYNDYNLTLTISELVASLVLKSTSYNWLISKMLEDENWNVILAGIRTYSKLAEIDEELVDISELIKISLKLDGKTFLNENERTASIHIIRTVGKINRHPNGEAIIKFLSTKGQVSKEIAMNAIAFDFASNGPIFLTDLLQGKSKRQIKSVAPSDQQINILKKFSNDINMGVKKAALDILREINKSWGISIDKNLFENEGNEILRGGKVNFSVGAPFSGFLLRMNVANQMSYKDKLPQGTVVLIESGETMEFLFRDASGIIVNDGGSLSHRCIRLRGMGIPFASINYDLLKDIPDRTFISINEEFFEFDIGRPMIL